MSTKVYRATGTWGGTWTSDDVYDLDSLSVSELNDGDLALVTVSSALYIYVFNATSTVAHSNPNHIRPTDFVSAGVWDLLTVNQATEYLSSGVILTGGVYGLNYSRTSDNVITVEAGNCRDATNTSWLSAAASQTVDIDTTADAIYHLFLCSNGTVKTDTDHLGATSLSWAIKRWIGFVKNNSSGNLIQFLQSGNLFSFSKADEAELATVTTSMTQPSMSTILPEDRIDGIEYGAREIATASPIAASEDGTNISFYVGYGSTNSLTANGAFGSAEYQKSSMKIYNPDRYFQAGTANTKLLVHSLLMKR